MYCVIYVIIIICIWLYFQPTSEQFASKREKAQVIYDWFNTNEPKYVNYKQDLAKASNIVEYEDVFILKQKNKLSVDNIEKMTLTKCFSC